MKVYVVGGRYLRTQDDAKAHAKEIGVAFNQTQHQEEVPTDQKGLIDYLNDLVQSLYRPAPVEAVTAAAPAPREASYAEQSVDIDDAFQRLPVAHQLTLTTLAHENAVAEIARLRARIDAAGLDAKVVVARAEPALADIDDFI